MIQLTDDRRGAPSSAAPALAPPRTLQLRADGLIRPALRPPLVEVDPQQLRRVLNVMVAIVGMVVALPVMALIALAIKLTSPGPVFYSQDRVGVDRRNPDLPAGNWRRRVDHGGRLFRVYKFRTMVSDSDRYGQIWATPDDPRVTRVGRFLRKYRLDELPQLWNVLKGDMNIVGPRPEQPRIFKELREQVEQYARRQRVLPGITGLAQVNHRYDQSVDDVRVKLRYDLQYMKSQGVVEDLRIMLRTIPAVLANRNSAW